ncbi:MAG: SDR family NAD(P)-dependent oxidoreductase [Gordonia sp. (in: high G+C Gram-positive bacteria)]|uniref:SDR family NAD(P)-dependent oxidoreductase n=1 Tax=Gordonia sp. (in: high G+C Gram-positive bacteria) TaxID=84139 RepID=UPI0039E2EBF8
MRFDGKVALVTGSSRGLGRAHAELLAELGAAVVINGTEGSRALSDEVVAGIKAKGGRAVAAIGAVNTDAEAIVATAIEEFGRLDIVVNNAGINTLSPFGPGILEKVKHHMDVNFFGHVAVTEAAWPHLVASGAGRIVNTASPTVVGFEEQTPYVASKGAIMSYTRTLSIEALELGIKVNAVAPTAYTRMAAEAELPQEMKDVLAQKMTSQMVAPIVAFLAHEDCPVTGETLLSQGGLMQRLALSINDGYMNNTATVDDVRDHFDEIMDDSTSKPLGVIGDPETASLLDVVLNG